MNKIEEIFTAWRISFNPNEAQSDIASERIQICDVCEFKETIAMGPIDIFTRCKVCGCSLRLKMFTPVTYRDPGGSCPHGKWMQVEKTWLEQKEQSIAVEKESEILIPLVDENAEIPIPLSTLLSSNLPISPIPLKDISLVSVTTVTTTLIK